MNDVVTDAGQLDLVEQLNRMSITLDLDHDTWRDEQGKTLQSPKALIPAGKIIKAEKHDNGTYVEAEINEFHPFYDKIAGSIIQTFGGIQSKIQVVTKHTTSHVWGVYRRHQQAIQ